MGRTFKTKSSCLSKLKIGDIFGNLTIINLNGGYKKISKNILALSVACLCKCGAKCQKFPNQLLNGNAKSCGCLSYHSMKYESRETVAAAIRDRVRKIIICAERRGIK